MVCGIEGVLDGSKSRRSHFGFVVVVVIVVVLVLDFVLFLFF